MKNEKESDSDFDLPDIWDLSLWETFGEEDPDDAYDRKKDRDMDLCP